MRSDDPDDIAIVGIAETPATRRSSSDVRQLTVDAVLAAIADAGLAPGDIDAIVTESVIMPSTVPHDWMAAQLGVDRCFDAAISYGGAGTVTAPLLARTALNQGLARYVLCYFGVDWGSRAGGPYAFHDMYPAKVAFEHPHGFNAQPAYFALMANRYAHEYGLDERHLGAIATTQRENSRRTGRGQRQDSLTMDEYLAADLICDPLRYPDCCVISDGAAAFVLTTAERARDCPHPPVYVRGVGLGSTAISGDSAFTQNPDYVSLPGVAIARERAERDSGLSVTEVDFAELYDCFTISCLLQLEDLGLCPRGKAGAFLAAGENRLDGRLPINTHGGLLSYSYLLGAEHVVEAVRQLRGKAGPVQVPNAHTGLVTGLSVPDYGILMLGR